jgi:hypothetical protein
MNERERPRAGTFQSSSSAHASHPSLLAAVRRSWTLRLASSQGGAVGLRPSKPQPAGPSHHHHHSTLHAPRSPRAPATEGVVVYLSVGLRLGIACARWGRARAFHRGGRKKALTQPPSEPHIPPHHPAATLHALRKALRLLHYSAASRSSGDTIEAVHGSPFCIRRHTSSVELIRRHGTPAAA